MNPPIVMAAFGTSTRAMQTYEVVASAIHEQFPDNELIWAFTSRYVRPHMKKIKSAAKPPQQVLAELYSRGIDWAVVQSFHIICGHEFQRLITETGPAAIRVSIGHSLMCSPQDHLAVMQALSPILDQDQNEAVVLVGHGTDHCCWSTYMAFENLLKNNYGNRVHVGVVEGNYPRREDVIRTILKNGYNRVRLVPLMLVAGLHFREDLAGSGDSWKTAFESAGIEVVLEPHGLGMKKDIAWIFCRHIHQALDLIPIKPE